MNQPLGPVYLLGTTNLGRDIFSQVVYGARSALIVGLSAALIVVVIGTVAYLALGWLHESLIGVAVR